MVLLHASNARAERPRNFREQGDQPTGNPVIDLELCDGPNINCPLPTVYLRPASHAILKFPSETSNCQWDGKVLKVEPADEEAVSGSDTRSEAGKIFKSYAVKFVALNEIAEALRKQGKSLTAMPITWFTCQVRTDENEMVWKTINVGVGAKGDRIREFNTVVNFHFPGEAIGKNTGAGLTRIDFAKKKTRGGKNEEKKEGSVGLVLTDEERREAIKRMHRINLDDLK